MAESGANMTRKRWAEKHADGRTLLRETFEGNATFTRDGVLEHSLRFTEASEKDTGIVGTLEVVVAQSDIINRNRRIYTKRVYELGVVRAQALVDAGKFLGEVDHPWEGSLEGAAIRWTKVWMDGAFMKATGVILKTIPGQHLKGLLDGKVGVGISTRGYASYVTETRELEGVPVEVDIIGEDYTMEGIDAVLFESNKAGAVTAHSESTNSRTNEGAKVMLTLEKLLAEHAPLVAQVQAAAREGYLAQADVDAKVAASKAEGIEEGKTATLASAEVKEALDIATKLKGIIAPAPKVEAEQTESDKLAAKVAELTQKLEAQDAEKARLATEAAATQKKQAVETKSTELLATLPEHADALRPDLLACESVEAVQATFDARKALIEGSIARARVAAQGQGAGVGTADAKTGDEGTEPLSEEEKAVLEDANRVRRINRQVEWTTLPAQYRLKKA